MDNFSIGKCADNLLQKLKKQRELNQISLSKSKKPDTPEEKIIKKIWKRYKINNLQTNSAEISTIKCEDNSIYKIYIFAPTSAEKFSLFHHLSQLKLQISIEIKKSDIRIYI